MAPEAWLPPTEIQQLRALTRTRKALVDERTAMAERVQALLFHEGWPCQRGRLLTRTGRQWVSALSRRAQQDRRLQALQRIYGVGPIVACHLLAEIGDARRFRRARQVVRLSGLDPVVLESGQTKRRGRLAKAGPPLLRWALVEAVKHASRSQSPDHERWLGIKSRRGSTVADLTVARTIAGRAYRILRDLDEAA
jgi:transposase